jgi:chemotaxis-related protein WspB
VPVPVVAFEVAGERYGIEAAGVVEVVPAVPLRTVPGTVAGVVGLLRFRGALTPVVDLGVVWAGRPSPARMSSRIVVCELEGAGGSWADSASSARPRVGLLAERVLRVAAVDPDASEAGEGPKTPGAKGLGRIVRDGDALLQLVRVLDLVPADVLASLVRAAEAVPGAEEVHP